jgi:hypothetical protein
MLAIAARTICHGLGFGACRQEKSFCGSCAFFAPFVVVIPETAVSD